MIVTSGQTLSRSLYPQTGDFRAVFDIANMPSGNLSIDLVENSLTASYEFIDKRFQDYLGNFSHIYDIGSRLKFEVAKSGAVVCEWINDTLIKSYYWDSIYFPSTLTDVRIGGTPQTFDFSFEFYGDKPNITYLPIETQDSYSYSGKIVNNSLATKLFNASGLGFDVTYPSVISGGTTGTYYFQTSGLASYTDTEIVFDFDFGKEYQLISISDPNYVQAVPTGFTNFSINTNNIYENSPAYFNITDYARADRNLTVSLEHVERIGSEYYQGTGYGTGIYSGHINGSGYLESYNLSGYISGYLGNGYGQKFHYASGQVIADYVLTVVGYEAGNLSTGVLVGSMTGIVNPGSGYYNFVGTMVGTPPVSVWGGGVNVAPVGSYTGSYNFIKVATGYYTMPSSGTMTLGVSSGPISGSGVQNYFTLSTGELGYSQTDYTSNGYYSSDTFSHSVALDSGEIYDLEGYVGYINGTYGIYDKAILTVQGEYFYNQTEIYGTLSQQQSNDRIFVGYVIRKELGSPVYKSRYYYPDTEVYVEE